MISTLSQRCGVEASAAITLRREMNYYSSSRCILAVGRNRNNKAINKELERATVIALALRGTQHRRGSCTASSGAWADSAANAWTYVRAACVAAAVSSTATSPKSWRLQLQTACPQVYQSEVGRQLKRITIRVRYFSRYALWIHSGGNFWGVKRRNRAQLFEEMSEFWNLSYYVCKISIRSYS